MKKTEKSINCEDNSMAKVNTEPNFNTAMKRGVRLPSAPRRMRLWLVDFVFYGGALRLFAFLLVAAFTVSVYLLYTGEYFFHSKGRDKELNKIFGKQSVPDTVILKEPQLLFSKEREYFAHRLTDVKVEENILKWSVASAVLPTGKKINILFDSDELRDAEMARIQAIQKEAKRVSRSHKNVYFNDLSIGNRDKLRRGR